MRLLPAMLLVAVAAAPLATAGTAHADPDPSAVTTTTPTVPAATPAVAAATPAAAPAEPERTWYGWQTLIADVFTIGTVGGPIVHTAHGNYLKALGSFGIRVGSAVAGLVIGMAAGGVREDTEMAGNAAGGLACGLLAASIFDAAVLAYDSPPEPRATVAPRVGVVRGGATIGVGGSF